MTQEAAGSSPVIYPTFLPNFDQNDKYAFCRLVYLRFIFILYGSISSITETLIIKNKYMSKEILTTNEAADLLGIARTSLINWVERGELAPATTPGGHRRFRRSDLMTFAEKRGFDVTVSADKKLKDDSEPDRAKVLIVDDDEDFR